MSPRRILGWATAVAVALLALPAVSSAAPKTYVSHGGSVVYARVHGSNGYRLNFSENEKRYFDVHVVGHGTTTRYDLHGGPVAGGRVSANLGRRGSFDLHFVPVGKSQAVPIVNWCSGPKGRWQPGYLVGRLRFRGERGYTEVHLHKLPAARETWSSLHCHYLSSAAFRSERKERAARLNVRPVKSDRGSSVYEYFGATLYHRHARPHGRRVLFHVSRLEVGGEDLDRARGNGGGAGIGLPLPRRDEAAGRGRSAAACPVQRQRQLHPHGRIDLRMGR